MPLPRIPRVPDDWTVWAFSDTHGVTSGLLAALRAAGIVDEALHWAAPPRTALVGCGDYLDRGVDVRGLVRPAAAAGGGGPCRRWQRSSWRVATMRPCRS